MVSLKLNLSRQSNLAALNVTLQSNYLIRLLIIFNKISMKLMSLSSRETILLTINGKKLHKLSNTSDHLFKIKSNKKSTQNIFSQLLETMSIFLIIKLIQAQFLKKASKFIEFINQIQNNMWPLWVLTLYFATIWIFIYFLTRLLQSDNLKCCKRLLNRIKTFIWWVILRCHQDLVLKLINWFLDQFWTNINTKFLVNFMDIPTLMNSL